MTNQEFAGVPFLSKPRGLLPIGSPERDVATLEYLKIKWQTYSLDVKIWKKTIAQVEDERIWERYPPEKPYGSLDALLKAEIGFTVAESIGTIQERTRVRSHVAKPAMKHGRPSKEDREKGDNYNLYKDRGTSAEYLTSVIARDHPDVHEAMKAGKYRSVREAAIDAGIVKPSDQWTAPGPVEKLAAAILRRYSTQQIEQLKELL